MKFVLFIILVCIHLGDLREQKRKNPKNPKKNTRILGGDEIVISDFPYVVSLLIRQDDAHTRIDDWTMLCGGVIIGLYAVLTSGSCVHHLQKNELLLTDIIVRGNTETWGCACGRARDHAISSYIIHEDYREISKPFQPAIHFNDLGIITVTNSFQGPFELIKSYNDLWVDSMVIGFGWGYTDPVTQRESENLVKASFNVLDNEACKNVYKKRKFPAEAFCVGYFEDDGNRVPCDYDSGGPIVNMDLQLMGIISSGQQCQQTPAIVTNVTMYVSWIDGKLNTDNNNPNNWY